MIEVSLGGFIRLVGSRFVVEDFEESRSLLDVASSHVLF